MENVHLFKKKYYTAISLSPPTLEILTKNNENMFPMRAKTPLFLVSGCSVGMQCMCKLITKITREMNQAPYQNKLIDGLEEKKEIIKKLSHLRSSIRPFIQLWMKRFKHGTVNTN